MCRKIKIIHIITRLDKGGSAENVLCSCEYFAYKKYPVKNDYEIVLIYGGQKLLQQVINNELKIKNYYIKELQRNISPIRDFISFIKILKIIQKEKPDIIHTHSSKAGILGRWAAFIYNCKLQIANWKLKRAKIIHTPHGHVFYGYYNKIITTIFILIEKITAIITDKLIALTEGEKNETLSYGIGKPSQWMIIHSGVNYINQIDNYKLKNLKNELNIKENEIVIGSVARLEPIKGIRYLIDAIPFIINSLSLSYFLTFLIVGDGTEKKDLEETLIKQNFVSTYKNFINKSKITIFEKETKNNLKIKVIFTGMREDVFQLMSIMDIYVQPSINEGMGKTIIMASMLGKAIIGTKVQGIPSVVVDNKTGILVPSKNSQKLAEAIVNLIKDRNLRISMGENAKIFVSEIIDGFPKFTIERMIYLLENLYLELIFKNN